MKSCVILWAISFLCMAMPVKAEEEDSYFQKIGDLIKQTNCDDKIIIISTHIVDDAEFLCDYIEIIDQGYIIAKDTTDGIKTAMTRLWASPSIDTSEPASADPTLEDGYMYILKSYRNGV